jgi:hypothetical protein
VQQPGRPRASSPTPSGCHGWSRSACGRGALAPLRTLHLCGESLHSLQAVPPVGKALWLASELPASSAYSPASGLQRRPSPAACGSPLAGDAPATRQGSTMEKSSKCQSRFVGIPQPLGHILRNPSNPLAGRSPWFRAFSQGLLFVSHCFGAKAAWGIHTLLALGRTGEPHCRLMLKLTASDRGNDMDSLLGVA